MQKTSLPILQRTIFKQRPNLKIIWFPMHYFLIHFIDDFTHFYTIYFMPHTISMWSQRYVIWQFTTKWHIWSIWKRQIYHNLRQTSVYFMMLDVKKLSGVVLLFFVVDNVAKSLVLSKFFGCVNSVCSCCESTSSSSSVPSISSVNPN